MQLSRREFLSVLLASVLRRGREAVDAHIHFWDPRRFEYAWLRGSPLKRPYLPEDYFSRTGGRVGKVIFVQAECRPDQALWEAEWAAQLAQQERRIAAIVAYAPVMDKAALGKTLKRLGRTRIVRGVRYLTQASADAAICARAEFIAGVQRVADAGLIFEAGVNPEQLPALVTLAERCPKARLVLDHLGNPPMAEGRFASWAESIRRVAGRPNVYCKISGVMERAGKNWTRPGVRRWIDHALDCFGGERVLWGSDWPVCLTASEPTAWLDAVKELTQGRGAEFQRQLFAGNARRLFRF